MSNAERLSELARALPEHLAGEVLDFVLRLQAKAQDSALAHQEDLASWLDQCGSEPLGVEEARQVDAAFLDPSPRVSGEELFKELGLL